MDNTNNQQLFESLALLLAEGTLSPEQALPALRKLQSPGENDLPDILKLLELEDSNSLRLISQSLKDKRRKAALDFYLLNRESNVKKGQFDKTLAGFSLQVEADWDNEDDSLEKFCLIYDDWQFIKNKQNCPSIKTIIKQNYENAVAAITTRSWSGVDLKELIGDIWLIADNDCRKELRLLKEKLEDQVDVSLLSLQKGYEADADNDWLDEVFAWRHRNIALFMKSLLENNKLTERVELLLCMRFGNQGNWSTYLDGEAKLLDRSLKVKAALSKKHAAKLLLLWSQKNDSENSACIDSLKTLAGVGSELMPFLQKWAHYINAKERNELLGIATETASLQEPELEVLEQHSPPVIQADTSESTAIERSEVDVAAKAGVEAEVTVLQAKEVEAAEAELVEPELVEKEPSIWDDHMKPFLTEYWFLTVGVIMVIGGSSLVAYIMWDKHWLVRYTLMPTLLAGFTVGMGYLGGWVEKKGQEFTGLATILRGAAVLMLPVNCMTVALMSNDTQVPHRELAVLAMGLTYLILGWLGLRKWCLGVSEKLTSNLTYTVLSLNALVILAPLAKAFGLNNNMLSFILGGGFYLGFAVMAFSVLHFTKFILTKDTVQEKHLPWFFGTVLLGTFCQVFFWVHGFIRELPQVHTYAPMFILAAALLFSVERRSLSLLKKDVDSEGESFLGYALIIVGMLMAVGNPYARIVVCLLAGAVWMRQAGNKRNLIHYHIALGLLMLTFISLGLLPNFPKEFINLLGLMAAACLVAVAQVARKKRIFQLVQAANNTMAAVLLLTVFVALLTEWQLRTEALLTAATLVSCAGFFAWKSYDEDQLHWVHTAMFLLAMALPYCGCVDLDTRTLEGNHLIFGLTVLSILWIGLNHFCKTALIREARSTVLWFYGLLAVVAMVIRVMLEGRVSINPEWYTEVLFYSGPLLMTAILLLTTYYSRSLVPAFMSAAIAVILFPELKANFKETFEMVGIGSGLGSGITSLVCIIVAFKLRHLKFFRNLSKGDLFLGKYEFPWRRYDHTLFTWPLMLSAGFLVMKTGTFNLTSLILKDSVSVKASLALLLLALCFGLLAVYFRRQRGRYCFIPACFYFWLGLHFLGIAVETEIHWSLPILLTEVVLLGLYLCCLKLAKGNSKYDWLNDVFKVPAFNALAVISFITTLITMTALTDGVDADTLLMLMIFNGCMLLWHGYVRQKSSFIYLLYIFIGFNQIPWSNGRNPDNTYLALLTLPTMILIINLMFEKRFKLKKLFAPVLQPLNNAALVSLCLFTLLGLFVSTMCSSYGETAFSAESYITAAVLLFAARTYGNRLFVLAAAIITYLTYHQGMELALTPLNTALFSFVLVLFTFGTQVVASFSTHYVAGFNTWRRWRTKSPGWLLIPAMLLAAYATFTHSTTDWQLDILQLWAPYLAFATFTLAARSWKKIQLATGAILCLTFAQIQLIHFTCGESLKSGGLSESHILCLSLGLNLLLAGAVRRFSKSRTLTSYLSKSATLMAAVVLFVLCGNYLVHPNLEEIMPLRFAVSGLMALLASYYFRYSARHPLPEEDAFSKYFEGFYHLGVSIAFWCGALMLPFLRSPSMAMTAFALPALYFYLNAEFRFKNKQQRAERYRNSSTVLTFLLLTLYVCRPFFHVIFFPDVVINTNFFHHNAPVVTLLGLLLFRLHGLGGSRWLAFYGGITVVTGTFFMISSFPSLSPFTYPIRAAWLATGCAHFWIILNRLKSPIRTSMQKLSALNDEQWMALRLPWGVCLLVGSHFVLLTGLAQATTQPLMLAPLFLAAASVSLHLFIARGALPYVVIAALEILVALHADYFVESYLNKELIVWVLALFWACLLMVQAFHKNKIPTKLCTTIATGLGVLMLIQLFQLKGWTTNGLSCIAALGFLTALTPCKKTSLLTAESKVLASLLLLLPTILVYLGLYAPSEALIQKGPLPLSLLTLLTTTLGIHFFKIHFAHKASMFWQQDYRFYSLTLDWVIDKTYDIFQVLLWSVSIGSLLTPFIFRNEPFFNSTNLMAMLVVPGALALAWFKHGAITRRTHSFVMMIFSALLFFVVIRQQLFLTTDLWRVSYDIWFCLILALAIAGLKESIDGFYEELRKPLLGLLLSLPFIALGWAYYHNLGTDVTLIVLGMNSLVFTFLARNDRASSYSLLSVSGFLAFTMLCLTSKFHLHSIHSYIIPTGIGILVLLHLFHDKIESVVRNKIRLITLTGMVSATAYYALILEPHSLMFNVTLLTLCMLAMLMGGLLKIRLYIVIGFCGLLINLASILVRAVISLDRGSKMTVLGAVILVLGSAVVFGTLYYKTHQESIRLRVQALRDKFGRWE